MPGVGICATRGPHVFSRTTKAGTGLGKGHALSPDSKGMQTYTKTCPHSNSTLRIRHPHLTARLPHPPHCACMQASLAHTQAPGPSFARSKEYQKQARVRKDSSLLAPACMCYVFEDLGLERLDAWVDRLPGCLDGWTSPGCIHRAVHRGPLGTPPGCLPG